VNEDILYAGMYRGVYVSIDRGESWSLLGEGMPAAAVSDLVIQERELDLVAATHGRGIYRMNLGPLHTAFENGGPGTHILFDIPTARLPWINDTHRDPRYSTMERTPITFYLMQETRVTISVMDSDGQAVWSHELQGRRGFNQVMWDLVTERNDSLEAYFWRYLTFIREGTYELQISGENVDLKGMLTVVERDSY